LECTGFGTKLIAIGHVPGGGKTLQKVPGLAISLVKLQKATASIYTTSPKGTQRPSK